MLMGSRPPSDRAARWRRRSMTPPPSPTPTTPPPPSPTAALRSSTPINRPPCHPLWRRRSPLPQPPSSSRLCLPASRPRRSRCLHSLPALHRRHRPPKSRRTSVAKRTRRRPRLTGLAVFRRRPTRACRRSPPSRWGARRAVLREWAQCSAPATRPPPPSARTRRGAPAASSRGCRLRTASTASRSTRCSPSSRRVALSTWGADRWEGSRWRPTRV